MAAPVPSRVKVAVRLRPGGDPGVVGGSGKLLTLRDPHKEALSEFHLDKVLDDSVQQPELYTEVGEPLVQHALAGYNTCCLAYGQTGSGKTYSMFGPPGEAVAGDTRGVVPRLVEHVFTEAAVLESLGATVGIKLTFLELYLDQLTDLARAATAAAKRPLSARKLAADGAGAAGDAPTLELQEDESGATHVKGLTPIDVASAEDALAVIAASVRLRQTASTSQNDVSSRSHTVFSILVSIDNNDGTDIIKGRIDLVDLAGSERLKKSESSGQRLKEAKSINSSLTALGKVVLTLAQDEKAEHVPYRDAKLTRVLKNSLSGNSYTTLLATLNPKADDFEECLNTVQFAFRCLHVQTQPRVNYLPVGAEGIAAQDKLVAKLTQEVADLRMQLEATHAHYQKQLEALGGPGYLSDLGPVEHSGAEDDEEDGERLLVEGGATGVADTAAASASTAAAPDAEGKGLVKAVTTKKGGGRAKLAATGPSDENNAALLAAMDKARGLEERLHQVTQDARKMREEKMAAENAHHQEMKALKKQVEQADAKQADMKKSFENSLKAQKKEHQEQLREAAAERVALKQQMQQMLVSIPAGVGGDGNKNDFAEAAAAAAKVAAQREQLEADYRKKLELAQKQKAEQIGNLKEQSTFFINKKAAELAKCEKEYGEYKAVTTERMESLEAQNAHLVTYSRKLAAVIENMERNVFTLKDKGGVRSIIVPAKMRPGMLDTTLCHDAVVAAERLLTEWGMEIESDTSRVREGEAVRAALKVEMREQVKEEIEREVLEELASNPTVEYIRSLEAENARNAQFLAAERKKGSDLRVALESLRRSTTKLTLPAFTAAKRQEDSRARPQSSPASRAKATLPPRAVSAAPGMGPARASSASSNGMAMRASSVSVNRIF